MKKKVSKGGKGIRLEGKSPQIMRIIKNDQVVFKSEYTDNEGCPQITMYKIKNTSGTGCRCMKRKTCMATKLTCMTKGRWNFFIVARKNRSQLGDQFVSGMTEAAMPDGGRGRGQWPRHIRCGRQLGHLGRWHIRCQPRLDRWRALSRLETGLEGTPPLPATLLTPPTAVTPSSSTAMSTISSPRTPNVEGKPIPWQG